MSNQEAPPELSSFDKHVAYAKEHILLTIKMHGSMGYPNIKTHKQAKEEADLGMEHNSDWLKEAIQREPIYAEVMVDIVAEIIRQDTVTLLTQPEREWIADFVSGKMPIAKRGRGRTSKSQGCWQYFLLMIELCDEFNLKPMRNDSSPPTSACDVVAQAMGELGLTPANYQSIRDLWLVATSKKR